jgi:hypothetical protein
VQSGVAVFIFCDGIPLCSNCKISKAMKFRFWFKSETDVSRANLNFYASFFHRLICHVNVPNSVIGSTAKSWHGFIYN